MFLKYLKISTKIVIAPVIMSVMFGYAGWLTLNMLDDVKKESVMITGGLKNVAQEATTLLQIISDKRLVIEQYISSFENDYLLILKIKNYEAAVSLARLEKLLVDSRQHFLLKKIGKYNENLNLALHDAIKRGEETGESLIEDYSSILKINKIGNNAEQAAMHLQNNAWQSMDVGAKAIDGHLLSVMATVKNIGGSAILLGIVLALIIAFSVTVPIRKMVKAMDDIASGGGDLTHQLDARGRDEVACLAAGFNRFSESIRVIVLGVLESANQLALAANQLKQHSENVHNSIHIQESRTESVDVSVNNMSTTAHEIADNTISAKDAASVAESAAAESLRRMSDTVSSINKLAGAVDESAASMIRLEQGSENIGAVIDVIGDIAEQTNLLALNAAIEAARAGEQGRGFAVVADEVRTLASRTQGSTEEIRKMIETLQKDSREASNLMKQGTELANDSVERVTIASNIIDNVSASVDTIHKLNNQISTAAEQQNVMTADVSGNISSIKQMTADNVAEITCASDISEQVSSLASELQQRISRFKTA